ncbi:hypothetical protein QYZ88_007695 [Lachnospiraceae bacterium C1.1]|nr:hypothetical protein [Lachnospiraceae bacterium C1.1]
MGIFDIVKNKKVIEEIGDNEQIDTQSEKVEEYEVAIQGEKKKYCYMVVNRDNDVIFDKNGNPYFITVDEGSAPEWPKNWPQDVVRNARLDKELREEIKKDDQGNQSKEVKKRAKQQQKKDAKSKLLKKLEERISAKKMQNLEKKDENIKDQVIDPKVQEAPRGCKEEMEENCKAEASISQVEVVEKGSSGREKEADEVVKKSSMNETNNNEISSNINLTAVTSCVEKNAKQLSEDLTANVEDLIEVINKNGDKNFEKIGLYIDDRSKRICDTTKRTASDVARDISQKTQKHVENIVNRVNENGRSISESQDKILSKVNTVGKRVTELSESVEGIEGNLHRLNQLDEITELLSDKGLTMSRDIPPINADEEDIINLVRYSLKITEQLGYAARDLIRKQEVFKSQEKSNANEQLVMEQRIAKAHTEGIEEGKKAFIKHLLSKYEDVDTLRESDNNHVHAIWTLLTELGVSIDGEGYYEKGKEIELAESDIERMMGIYSKFEGAGKYRVLRTGLCFQGEILCNAIFERIAEAAETAVPEEEISKEKVFEEANKNVSESELVTEENE